MYWRGAFGLSFTHVLRTARALLAMTVQFRRGVGSRQVELSVDQIEDRGRAQFPEIQAHLREGRFGA